MSWPTLTLLHYLMQLIKIKKRGVLLGDFNINLLEYNTKNEVERFIDTTTSHNFFPTFTSNKNNW